MIQAKRAEYNNGQSLIHSVVAYVGRRNLKRHGLRPMLRSKKIKKVMVACAKRERDTSESDTACLNGLNVFEPRAKKQAEKQQYPTALSMS